MQITNLEELLQALGAKEVFKADGTLTKQAEMKICFKRNMMNKLC